MNFLSAAHLRSNYGEVLLKVLDNELINPVGWGLPLETLHFAKIGF